MTDRECVWANRVRRPGDAPGALVGGGRVMAREAPEVGRCRCCGRVLLWVAGTLQCANRGCELRGNARLDVTRPGDTGTPPVRP